jgi:uncharacterized protein YndB with AHSA1/START domain
MPWWLWIPIGLVGALVVLGVVLCLLGRGLPEGHVVSATLRLARPPAEVFAALADTAGVPSWDKGVDRVERLPDRDGHEAWRWTMGRNAMVLVTTRSEAPSVLVRTIADEAKFFSGDWTYAVRPDGAGCAVELTEHGRVHVALPRAMMRYMPFLADPAMYLKRHLVRLAGKFGEAPRIEVGAYVVVDGPG